MSNAIDILALADRLANVGCISSLTNKLANAFIPRISAAANCIPGGRPDCGTYCGAYCGEEYIPPSYTTKYCYYTKWQKYGVYSDCSIYGTCSNGCYITACRSNPVPISYQC